LLGMGVSGLEAAPADGEGNGDLLDSRAEQSIDRVLDTINRRYGAAGVVHGQTLRGKKS
jgi:hypothetical protein